VLQGEKKRTYSKKKSKNVEAMSSFTPLPENFVEIIEQPKDKLEEDIDEEDIVMRKADVIKAGKVIEDILPYYTFGPDVLIDIPVEKIRRPPSTYCYRPLSLEHVARLVKEMVKNPMVKPMPAVVIAYNIARKQTVTVNPKEVDPATFSKDWIEHLEFFAICGQHSTRAAHKLQEMAKEDGKFVAVASKLAKRQCQLLSAATPKDILLKLSSSNNETAKIPFKTPFLSTVRHARKQYADMGYPKKGAPGVLAEQKFQVSISTLCRN
jgi:hypothetical protein